MPANRVGRCFLLLVIVLSGTAVRADQDLPREALLTKVDALFQDCNRPDVPGCAVGIIQDGQLIYRKGFGTANLDYGVPNTPLTVFEIASASKAFTSACVALLMDEGKLRPDDDIRRLIPEMQLDRPVLIRHMLRCESGLWEQFHIMPLAGWDNVPNHVGYTKADLLAVLSGQKRLPFEPGSRFQYGSGDFFLLGLAVERVSGQTLAQFARQRLFEPLGMTHTYYEEDPGLSVKNRAVGHWKSDAGWSPKAPPGEAAWRVWQTQGYVAGPGGVRTCIDDLYRWDLGYDSDVLPRGPHLSEFLKDGTVLGNRFVSDADAYKKKEHPHPENAPAGEYRGLKRIQFTGGFWGLATCIARFPDQKFTVICLSNSGDVSPFTKTREIADLFLADALAPWPPLITAPESVITLKPEQLPPLTGAFRDPAGPSPIWRTEVRDGELVLIDHLDKAYVLQPLTATRFQPAPGSPFYTSARFEFVLDDAGMAQVLKLASREHGFQESYSFERVNLVQPSPETLAEYVGEYTGDELAATYRLKLEDGALWLRVNTRRWERLRPTLRDEFTLAHRDPHDQRVFRFARTPEGAVTGLTASLWRVKGVTFSKSALSGWAIRGYQKSFDEGSVGGRGWTDGKPR